MIFGKIKAPPFAAHYWAARNGGLNFNLKISPKRVGEQFHDKHCKAGCHSDLEKASSEKGKDKSREERYKSRNRALGRFKNCGEGHDRKGNVGNVL